MLGRQLIHVHTNYDAWRQNCQKLFLSAGFFFNGPFLFFLFFLFSLFYCCSSTVVSIFTPPWTPCCTHPCLLSLNLPPLALSMCPLYMFLDGSSPIFPHYPSPAPLWSLSVCFLFQCFWLYFACVCFVDQVPLIGEIICYLSFTAWLISLSIMLSSSIHAVAKGRSSFLSAVLHSIVIMFS